LSEARAAVEGAVAEIRRLVDPGSLVLFDQVEAALWPLLLALGRALLCLWLVQRVEAECSAVTRERGEPNGNRMTTLGTRCGRISFHRPLWRSSKRRRAELLVDERIGLSGRGFSLATVAGVARLAAQMAFASVRREWRDTYGWAPSSRAVLRMVDATGIAAQAFLEELPAPDDDGEVLVVQVDGKGAPMISPAEALRRAQPKSAATPTNHRIRRREKRVARARPRRTKGKKSKNARVVVVGIIYTLKRLPDGTYEGPINKRMIAQFGKHDDLVQWLRREADKRGYGKKLTLFLADGSKAIWTAQRKHFPKAKVCIDWYHIVEKLWTAGECVFGEGHAQLTAWVNARRRELRAGQITRLLAELQARLAAIPRSGPGTKGRRARLSKIIAHLKYHRRRLRYRWFRRRGFDIGTGVVEGAVRNLVGMRLDGPGMRWGQERAQHLLHLRCILLSDLWPQFHDALGGPGALTLLPQPEPASPYEAKKRAA
jgi:hypothetical protein